MPQPKGYAAVHAPDPPYAVENTEHLWIEMADGVRLAARLWRPVTDHPVPAVLEYIPYRKTDMVRARDERNHPFFAAHGYACVRVDMRGSGDSDGHMPDMYAPAELDDARQVIEWLARQSWCSGSVGMFGTSWGGTASLQASVDAPAALKAVIAVCATHDRFEDDIHYMGGCVLSDTFEWGATLPAVLASPPTTATGPDWMDRWRNRIETLAFPLENWLREGGRGQYWRHGSVVHQTDALSVPILAVGGWSDRYSNSVMPLVNARPDLVWGVVGPWGHHYPDHGSPAPAMGFQQLALEWWDHWLKTPAPEELAWPRLRVWLREFDLPSDRLSMRNGRWIESGPSVSESEEQTLAFSDLLQTEGSAPWGIPDHSDVGVTSGDTGYFGRVGGLPLDQSVDDAKSLVFETGPLPQDLILYGAVHLQLEGTSVTGKGQIAARLNDVTPEGDVAKISYGLRNLALDDALDHPEVPNDPGPFKTRMSMHTTAYVVKKGHRLRLALSRALWPMIETTDAGDITLLSGRLALPVFQGNPEDLKCPLPLAEDLPVTKSYQAVEAPALTRWHTSEEDVEEVGWHQPRIRTAYIETHTSFGFETRMTHHLRKDVGGEHQVDVVHHMQFERPDGEASVDVALQAKQSDGAREVQAQLKVTWNGAEISNRHWHVVLPKPG